MVRIDVTDEEIDQAIYNCKWKKDIGGEDICSAYCIPCVKAIEDGKCDALINLYNCKED